MKIILSPAKTMHINAAPILPNHSLSEPGFAAEANMLNAKLAKMDASALKQLFKISDKLTTLTHAQIANFGDALTDAALFAFRGEVFKMLEPLDFDESTLNFTDSRLRIFSGLYGILRPLDAIKSYRLDFNTPLKIKGNLSLKRFWQSKIVDYFSEFTKSGETILNFASSEYSVILAQSVLKSNIVTFQFRENKKGTLKNVTVFSKHARGLFCRHVLQEKIEDADVLKNAKIAGYEFRADFSTTNEWFYVR